MAKPRKSQTQRNSIAVIGEGITEQYYLQSIKSYIEINIEPKLPKHSTGTKYLEDKIKECITAGYPHILCIIDMDNKEVGKEKIEYEKLKAKYHNKTIEKESKGLSSSVVFYENERCLELWFLYHFQYTTRKFNNYSELEDHLHDYIPNYQKTGRYFLGTRGLHRLITKDFDGDFDKAKMNAKNSTESKERDRRNYTYSEMKDFFDYLDKNYPRK